MEIASKTAVISQPEDEAAAAAGEEAVIHAALGRGFVRECKFRIDPKLQAAAEMSWEKDGERKRLFFFGIIPFPGNEWI